MTEVVTIRITGDKELNRYLKRIQANTPREGNYFAKKMAQFIVRSAKQRVAPMKTGTGRLMKSIMMHKSTKGYVVSAGRGVPRGYAYYQEFGFRPHSVRLSSLPKGSRLYQEASLGGARGRVFVRRYTPYMQPAFRKAVAILDTELNKTGNKILRG